MSDREARIRLTLQNDNFISKMSQATKQASQAMRDLETATKGVDKAANATAAKGSKIGAAFSTALGSVKKDFAAIGGQLKTLGTQAITLGGAFTMGKAIQGAVALKSGFTELAMRIELTTGKAVKWQDLQKSAQAAAALTTRTTSEMGDAFTRVFAATGDSKLAQESMTAIGTAATASGKSVEEMADLAGMLNRKFGTSAKELPEMFERIFEKADSGGASFDQIKSSLDGLATSAQRAGLKGKEGLTFMLETMRKLDADLGADKVAAGLKGIFDALDDKGPGLRQMEQSLNMSRQLDIFNGKAAPIRLQGKDAMGKVREVLRNYSDQGDMWDPNVGKRGGRTVSRFMDQLGTGSDAGKVMLKMMDPFKQAFDAARKSGASMAAAQKAGMAAFDKSVAESSKSNATGSKLGANAAAKAAEPWAKLRQSLETLEQGFRDPKVMDAIDELAKQLPQLAKALSQVTAWAIKNPLLAGGALIGGRAAMSVGTSLAGSALTAAGQGIAGAFSAQVAKSGVWGTAGAAVGIAAGAALAYQVGKLGIDKMISGDIDKRNENALKGGVNESVIEKGLRKGATGLDREAARIAAKESLLNMDEEDQNASVFSSQGSIGKLGIAADTVAGFVGLGSGTLGAAEQEQQDRANKRAKLEAKLRDLSAPAGGGGYAAGGEKDDAPAKHKMAAGETVKAAAALTNAASALTNAASRVGTSGGAAGGGMNGLPPRGGSIPGALGG